MLFLFSFWNAGYSGFKKWCKIKIEKSRTINRNNYQSIVDKNGTTYKYNPKTNILVEVTKNGYTISYRYYGKSFWYIDKKEIKKLIKK